jgi:hypothetical protein
MAATVGAAGNAERADAEPWVAPGDAAQDPYPRWLDAVRAQRRALQEHRRVEHQARRRAMDPVGSARHEALEQTLERRRQELRDLRDRREMMAEERRLFMNMGPWVTPWPPPPGSAQPAPAPVMPDAKPAAPPDWPQQSPPATELPEWDNGWYFRGW